MKLVNGEWQDVPDWFDGSGSEANLLGAKNDSPTGIYTFKDKNGYQWNIMNGVAMPFNSTGYVPTQDVVDMFSKNGIRVGTQQDVSNSLNQDAPGNGAGKGSMKEGVLSALSFIASAGMGSMFPGLSPTELMAAKAAASTALGGNPLASIAMSGAGSFLPGGGNLDISGGLDGPAFELGPDPTGVGTGNSWTTAGGTPDTGYGANTVPTDPGTSPLTGVDPWKVLGGAGAAAAVANSFGGNDSSINTTGLTGNGPNFYDTGGDGPYAGLGQLNNVDYGGSILDQFPNGQSSTGNSAWDTYLNGGSGVTSGGGGGLSTGLYNLLSQLPAGTASALMRAVPGLLGAYGASRQASSLGSLAQQFQAAGAPSRARYEASFAPGFTMANDPGYQDALDASSKATLHSLSVNGNPAGSPNAWAASLADNNAKFAYPALQSYRTSALNASGIPAYNAAAPGAMTGQLQSNANVYNGIGSAIGNVTNPTQSLADILKQYQSGGGSSIFKVAA